MTFHLSNSIAGIIINGSFTGRGGTDTIDPLYGFKHLSDLYFKADPSYSARFTIPVLWDKKTETIVSNESSEIIRMFYLPSTLSSLLPSRNLEAKWWTTTKGFGEGH
jgi:glutathionyl-hydroquinone reductase